jgi:hypothetical protein
MQHWCRRGSTPTPASAHDGNPVGSTCHSKPVDRGDPILAWPARQHAGRERIQPRWPATCGHRSRLTGRRIGHAAVLDAYLPAGRGSGGDARSALSGTEPFTGSDTTSAPVGGQARKPAEEPRATALDLAVLPRIRPQNVPACFGAQNTACVLESAEPVNLSALHLDANLSFMSAESAIWPLRRWIKRWPDASEWTHPQRMIMPICAWKCTDATCAIRHERASSADGGAPGGEAPKDRGKSSHITTIGWSWSSRSDR